MYVTITRELLLALASAGTAAIIVSAVHRRRARRCVFNFARRGFAYLEMRQERHALLHGIDFAIAFDPEHSAERDRRLREGRWELDD